MKLEIIQKQGEHFTWRELLQDNEKEKTIYDKNNPVGHYIYLPDQEHIITMYLGSYDTKHRLYHFAEKGLKIEFFNSLSTIRGINIRHSSYTLDNEDQLIIDADTIIDINNTPRGTKAFEEKLAKIYKKSTMITFTFDDDGVSIKDIRYEFNCKFVNKYKSDYVFISVFNKTEGLNNDPITIGGVTFQQVSFILDNIHYDALYGEGRVKARDIPKGLYKYEIRGSDEDPGKPYSLEYMAKASFIATLLTYNQIKFDDKGYIAIEDLLIF